MTRGAAMGALLLCLRAAARDAAPCAIGGSVLDETGGQPVVRARVLAVEMEAPYALMRFTDERGAFCFEKLAPAGYRVVVQKPGYIEIRYGTTLAVEEDAEVPPLALHMTRYAGVSGTVRDSAGEAAPGVEITVYQRRRGAESGGAELVESALADSRGAFQIPRLDPGTYFLSVKPGEDDDESRYAFPFADSHGQMPREREVETFYASSFTFEDATPLELAAGQRLEGLVLTLNKARLRRVTGRIEHPPGRSFLYFETASGLGGAVPIAADGAFAKTGLTPGKYTFQLQEGARPIARKEVDLTMGDALGVTLDPIEALDIPVTVRTEGKGPAFRPRKPTGFPMLAQEGSDEAAPLRTAADGTYRYSLGERGIYRLILGPGNGSLYIKEVTYGGAAQRGDRVDLRRARPGGIEITFSYNVAEVQGKVISPADQASDLTVILVDESKDGDAERIACHADTDQKGRFKMTGLPPGRYRLFAIAGFDEDRWGSPQLAKVLEAKSAELELKESDRKQVSVTVISAAEWAAAVKKAGG